MRAAVLGLALGRGGLVQGLVQGGLALGLVQYPPKKNTTYINSYDFF